MTRVRELLHRHGWLVSWPVLLAIVIFLLATFYGRPPVVFAAATLDTQKACEGNISFQGTWTVRDAPVTLIMFVTVFDQSQQRTVQADTDPVYLIYTEGTAIDRTVNVPLAKPLKAGAYELRVAFQTFTSKPAILSIPFTVQADCEPPS